DQLADEVARIKRRLTEGVALSTPPAANLNASSGPATGASAVAAKNTDAWTHLRAAEQMEGFARGGWCMDNFGTKVGKLTPLIATDVYQSWCENQVMETLAQRDSYTL